MLRIDATVRDWAEWLGRLIALRSPVFFMLPLCCASGLLYPCIRGLQEIRRDKMAASSAIQLFTPEARESARHKRRLAELFTDGGYFGDRTLVSANLLIAIIAAKDGASVLDWQVAQLYIRLRTLLESVEFSHERSIYNYRGLCTHYDVHGSHCRPDPVMLLYQMQNDSRWQPKIRYPTVTINIPFGARRGDNSPAHTDLYIGPLFGDVVTDANGYIESAKYVRMIFNLPVNMSRDVMHAFSEAWLEKIRTVEMAARLTVDITYWTSWQYAKDAAEVSRRTTRLLPILTSVLLLFSLTSCCMRDAVASKPLLALGGIASAALAIICAQGLLYLMGVRLIQIAMIVPFLVLSIGVDDTFVMINVWRRTNSRLSVVDRLAVTYRDCAVSILLTTLTDCLVFVVGTFSPFPAIRIFCLYSSLSIALVFVFQVTLFGALTAWDGERERRGRHCLLVFSAVDGKHSDASFKQRSCFASNNVANLHKPLPVILLSAYYAKLFDNIWFNLLVAASYLCYIAVIIYSIGSGVQQGLIVSTLVPRDTPTYRYLTIYETHFTKYGTLLEVAVGQRLEYSDPWTQKVLLSAALDFERLEFTSGTSRFWLMDYLEYLKTYNGSASVSRADFYALLANDFLQRPDFAHHAADIVLMHQGDTEDVFINASRFYVPLYEVNTERRSAAMHAIFDLLDQFKLTYNLTLFAYDVSFPMADQSDAIPTNTITSIVVAGLCMLLCAVLFVPKTSGCLLIAVAVISINAGVFGLLNSWNVHLDIISMITILLSIGFSVDFSTHIIYHYHYATGDDIQKKIEQAFETVAWPVVQSSLSTLLGVLTVLAVNAYVSETFVKTVALVMFIGLYHSLCVLPTVMAAGRLDVVSRVDTIYDRGVEWFGGVPHLSSTPSTTVSTSLSSVNRPFGDGGLIQAYAIGDVQNSYPRIAIVTPNRSFLTEDVIGHQATDYWLKPTDDVISYTKAANETVM